MQAAEAEVLRTTASDWLGLPLDSPPPLVHFSRLVQTRAWSLDLLT